MNSTSVSTNNIADIYAPPASTPAAPKKLFSIPQLGVATFLAVPAGLVLMAVNYRRIGKRLESYLAVFLTPIVTMLLVAAGLALPVGAPTFFIPFLIAMGVKKISMQEFGKDIAALETSGGRFESSWIVAGAVIAGLIITLGAVLGTMKVFNIG